MKNWKDIFSHADKFVGRDIEMQRCPFFVLGESVGGSDGYVYRGPIKSIKYSPEIVSVEFEWMARMHLPPNSSGWEEIDISDKAVPYAEGNADWPVTQEGERILFNVPGVLGVIMESGNLLRRPCTSKGKDAG